MSKRKAACAASSKRKSLKNDRSSEESTDSSESVSVGSNEEEGETNIKKQLNRLIKSHLNSGNKGMTYSPDQIQSVLDRVKTVFQKQQMLLTLKAPLKICGDIHGQFQDLKRIFRGFGRPPDVSYLFLGDYVDRGAYSLEVIMLLFAFKARFPNTIFLLRGNHECMNINRIYGFFDELQRRGHVQLYPEFNNVFNWMPIAALVDNKLLCMHGGISKHLKSLQQIEEIKRPLTMQPPHSNLQPLALDLLWADPDKKCSGYSKSKRGVSFRFGRDVLKEFCKKFKLELVVRAHQVVPRGFERWPEEGHATKLVTVFSAPNYCGEMDNCAAVMIVPANFAISFKVLEPSTDKELVIARNATRAQVPAFDVFPEMDVDFDPLTMSLTKAYDSLSSTTSSLGTQASEALRRIPFSEYKQSARSGLSQFANSFTKDKDKENKK